MHALRDYFEWMFSLNWSQATFMFAVTVVGALIVLAFVSLGLVWGIAGLKMLLGFRTRPYTAEEIAERDARHEVKKAELAERLKSARAARAVQRQSGHQTIPAVSPTKAFRQGFRKGWTRSG